jgi:hypothetical protein
MDLDFGRRHLGRHNQKSEPLRQYLAPSKTVPSGCVITTHSFALCLGLGR